MGSISHWQAEVSEASQADAPALAETLHADVAVVGAGITGAAAALELARAGLRVVVLEARTVAAGASGRNGGFLLGGTSETYAAAISRYGYGRALRVWDLSLDNHSRATELIAELAARDWSVGYRRTGSLRIAAGDIELAEVLGSVELLRADGWHTEFVEQRHLPARLQPHYLGASYHPADAEMQPVRFVRGVAALAESAGAQFYEHSPVTALRREGAAWRVATPGGAVVAEQVVLATNAWLPEVGALVEAPWLAEWVRPTRGQMLATAPVEERLFTCPCYADEGYQYWRQLADGRLVVGGWRNTSFATEDVLDETPTAPVQQRLEGFVRETLGLSDLPITQRWAGVMAFSRDGLPLVGRLPGQAGITLSGAYTGHGNAYALICAQIVAALVRGQTHPQANLFAVERAVAEGA